MKINNRKTTLLICPICNKEYYKTNSEINRNLKLNRLNFCSLSCSSKYTINFREDMINYRTSSKNYEHLQELNLKRQKEALLNFKYYLRKAVKERQYFDIDSQYLKELWNQQKGICPYTGIKLIPQLLSKSVNKDNPFIYASLDRIDSSKGYIKGNVEFVSLGINYLKNKFSKEVTVNFINLIKLQDAQAGN